MFDYAKLAKAKRESQMTQAGGISAIPAGLSNQAMISMLERQQAQTAARPASSGTPLADAMKAKFERQFGLPMDDVRVHRNSDEPAKFDAGAYTYGSDIFIGPGQEDTLEHEMTHVAQQKLGQVRPTGMEHGMAVNRSPALEHSADMGTVPQMAGGATGPVVQCADIERTTKRLPKKRTASERTASERTAPEGTAPERTAPEWRRLDRVPGRPAPFYMPEIDEGLARHHIVPVAKLKQCYDMLIPGGKMHNKSLWGKIVGCLIDETMGWIENNDRASDRLLQREALSELTSLRGKNAFKLLGEEQDILQQLFIWMPGNLAIGPANRENDPEDRFDEVANIVFFNAHGSNQRMHSEFYKKLSSMIGEKGKTPRGSGRELNEVVLEFIKESMAALRKNPGDKNLEEFQTADYWKVVEAEAVRKKAAETARSGETKPCPKGEPLPSKPERRNGADNP